MINSVNFTKSRNDTDITRNKTMIFLFFINCILSLSVLFFIYFFCFIINNSYIVAIYVRNKNFECFVWLF